MRAVARAPRHRTRLESSLAYAVLLARAGLLLIAPVSAASASPAAGTSTAAGAQAPRPKTAVSPSSDAARLLKWVAATGDNLGLPFIIIDKVHANVIAFRADGSEVGSAAALIGLGRGDVSPAGIGQRRLADMPPADRITPAGRFIASIGNDLGVADVLWIDYDAGVSLHRVITGNPKDHRKLRLASATTTDNRITYGCINVPVAYFESVVRPLFARTNGVVYILPEVRALGEVFHLSTSAERPHVEATTLSTSSSAHS